MLCLRGKRRGLLYSLRPGKEAERWICSRSGEILSTGGEYRMKNAFGEKRNKNRPGSARFWNCFHSRDERLPVYGRISHQCSRAQRASWDMSDRNGYSAHKPSSTKSTGTLCQCSIGVSIPCS